jgi:hypothetical protein
MDRERAIKPLSRRTYYIDYSGFGPAAYLSYIAAELDGGSHRMAYPIVFYSNFCPMIPAGVS